MHMILRHATHWQKHSSALTPLALSSRTANAGHCVHEVIPASLAYPSCTPPQISESDNQTL
eukprot:3940242-Rhodomonas_salina.4